MSDLQTLDQSIQRNGERSEKIKRKKCERNTKKLLCFKKEMYREVRIEHVQDNGSE